MKPEEVTIEDKRSEGLKLLTSAAVQIEMTLKKVDDALETVTGQLAQIKDNKIGLTAQKAMINELKRILEEKENPSPVPVTQNT